MLTPGTGAKAPASDPVISVVLPNYNHAELIERAVAALRAQKRAPDEIIIIDDASTDQSLRVIEKLAVGWSAVRVLANKQNQGAVAALARGLSVSKGKYVYFAAADDWVEPGFFSTAVDMMERHPQAGLYCGEADLMDGRTGRNLGKRPAVRPANRPGFFDPSAAADLLRNSDNWILTGSAVFRRDRVLEAGGFLPELGSFADGYLARKIALQYGFCYNPQTVATWSIFDAGLSRTGATNVDLATRLLTQALAHIAADRAFPGWYPALLERRWRFATSRLAVIARPINRPVLLEMGVQSRGGRALLDAICRLPLGPTGRLLLLGWLWFRFRPVRLAGLSKTIWARYWERRKDAREHAPAVPGRAKPGDMNSEDSLVALTDLRFPEVDFQVANPIPAIMESPAYLRAAEIFSAYPFDADLLISWNSLALLYATIRNQRPNQIVEIGSYKGTTAKVLAHALQANGLGTLHTVGPFDSHHFLPRYEQWPEQVKSRTVFYPTPSMDFFIQAELKRLQFDLVFVDGNHDYEFALFDILSAARRLTPGGFIFIDNVSQAGPYYAALDFTRQNPQWLSCDVASGSGNRHLAFDPQRSTIPGTDFIVLRAPRSFGLRSRPQTYGQVPWNLHKVQGVRLSLAGAEEVGEIWVQCVLRGFSATHMDEAVVTTLVHVDGTRSLVEVVFDPPLAIPESFAHYTVEPWFTWTGSKPLQLTELPICY